MDLILHPYGTLWATLAGPLHDTTMAMAQAMLTYVNANVRLAIVLMAALAILGWAAHADEHLPLHFFYKVAGIAFFMGTALSWPMYYKFILLIEGLPASLIAAVSGAKPQQDWAAALDVAANNAHGPIGMLSSAIDGSFWSVSLQRAIAFILLAAADALATIAFLVVFLANAFLNLSLDLLLAIGPLAVVMWLFPLTKQIAVSYLSAVMAVIVQMVALVVVMLLVDRVSDLLAVNLLKLDHGDLGRIIQAALICGSLYLALPFLAIGMMWSVARIWNGVVPGGVSSIIATPANAVSAAISGSGGGSSGGYSGAGGAIGSRASAANPMPGRPVGRGP